MLGRIRRWVHSMLKSFDLGLYSVLGLICSGGQVPLKSSGAMLLPLLVKVKIATFNPLPIFHCNGSVTVFSD
jgi:hypothetical protein